jgi:hypothetical protein
MTDTSNRLADNDPQGESPKASQPDKSPSTSNAVSKNLGNKHALRHGVYSYALLPWESQEDFEALHQSFRNDLKPRGSAQEHTIFTLTHCAWKRQRVLQMSQIGFYRSPVAKSLKTGEVDWNELVRSQSNLPNLHEQFLSSVWRLVKSLNSHHYWTNTSEGKDIQLQLHKMRTDMATLASNVRKHVIEGSKDIGEAMTTTTNLFDQAYQSEHIETQIRLLSTIDREIDKTLRRFASLRAFEDLEAAKEGRQIGPNPYIAAPSVIPGEYVELKEGSEADNAVVKEAPSVNPAPPGAISSANHE